MKRAKILLLSFLISLTSLFVSVAQNKPFPQSLAYPGCIKPAVPQSDLNSSVATFYEYWKKSYLRSDLQSLPGAYYVRGENTGDSDGFRALGSSEGMGYGMVITVLMAGYDRDAKMIFDGLYKTLRAYRSKKNPNLMGWVVADSKAAQGNFDSATDGDIDMAYALILAHFQWGSSGDINYLEEAKRMITGGIKASNVTTGNRLNLGDWDTKESLNTRPSDWMMSHMRAFYKLTGDITWLNVVNNLYDVYLSFINNYSPKTGLVADFIVGDPPKPCPANFLNEYPETNSYSYNACRVPLRIVMDFALYGSKDAYLIADKLSMWAKAASGSDPSAIKTGYTIDGRPLKNGSQAVFIAPFVAASVVNSQNQQFLDSGWELIKNKRAGYYSDSYNLLSMIFISGNWWKPE